jgi:glycine cleavage system H lipoate-binding protein
VVEDFGGQFSPVSALDIPQEGYHYSRNHWWAKKGDKGQFRLGIEAGLAQTLLAVKGIVFPSERQRLRKGQVCIWVVMDGGTLVLEAPLDGVVRTVNRELIDKPHLLCLQPFDDGWLCELELDDQDAAAAELMTAGQVRSKYAADRNRFVASLSNSFRGRRPAVGAIHADGGVPLQNFAEILGATRYIAQLRQFFGWTKKG